ncbi:MAG TPA: hypothetical protein ENL03_04125, partial [Phycisphaerae bacterium]|nr:hypothetical protein [Phycisphaerae bacterium]
MSESGLGMTYRHSMGLTFAHPANWAVQKTQFGLILTPPKPMVINGNDAESYLIMSEAAPGIKSPDDPRLAGYLDDLISTQMPSLVRTGQVESAKCGQSTGLIYHWQSPPDAAVDVIAQAYLCVSGESAVALLAIGPAESILARQEMLREIFSSFGRCEPETEPNPMGVWEHDDHYRTGEYASSW